MVDFNKKIVNSKKFLQPAIHFQEHGLYCFAPAGTTEYMEYWEREQDRCLNGYLADDGDWISGYNYFYLNYCPILRIVEKEIVDRTGKKKTRRERVREFPDFYDYDYYFFMAVQEAQEQGKHLAVLKSRRKGYEQPYSEDVLTPTGFRKMGDLEAGDLVMNPGGQPTVILEVVEQGMKDVYEVEFQDGRTVRCGENHLWSTVNATRGKIHIMRTKDYAKRKLIQGSPGKEYYPYKVPALNPLKFDSTAIDIDPYVLGVLIGDGCLSSSQIFFSSDDEFIVEEMRSRLPDYEIKKSKTPFQYVILSKNRQIHELGRKLKKYGLRVKSENKFIPEIFKHATIEDRFELVRGLMDTDGSCTKGASIFTNTSEALIDDLAYVLRSLGIRCKKSKEIAGRLNVDFNNGHFSDTKPHWELCITTEEDIFKLPRKLEKIRKDRQYNFNGIGIKAVRNLGYKEKQRCIVVDHENSLYITKDFIPTHNSFKLGAMMCRNYYHIPGSKSFAFAAENEFLVKDGIITKAWEYMDFIDENTAWGKKRQKVDTKMHRRASFVSTDDTGNKIELGYKSEIIGVTTKNDVNKIRGKAGHLIVIEEGGKFPNLLELWQIARPSVEQDGVAFGTMIVFGTGGSDGDDFSGLRELFYYPEGYNCLPLDNIWDEGADGTKCGFFIPQYTNLDIRDSEGTRLYMDEDGNTYKDKSKEYVLALREDTIKNSTDARAIDRYVAEQPCLDGDTLISTEDGISKISENTKSFITGTKDLYRLRTSDGTEVLITKNHPIYNGVEYIPLENMNVGDKIKYQSTVFKDNGYVKISIPGFIRATSTDIEIDEDWALFIGLFMGDGSFYGPTGNLKITMDRSDVESISWCSGFLERNFGDVYLKTVGKNGGGVDVGVNIKHSINVMKTLGVLKSSSNGSLMRNVHIPEYIYKSKKSVVASFLKGLFDSDGHAIKNGSSVGFFSKNNDVLQGVQFLLRGFDINANISNRNSINGNGRPYIENKLSIRACDIPKFREHIGFISKRKLDRIANYTPSRSISDYSYSTIESITYEKTDIVWDITTDSHSFSACGIWVHNCTPQEACLELTGNIFPKKELQAQLSLIRVNRKLQNHNHVGDLVWVNGELIWQQKQKGDITKYPLGKDDDTTGAIVIWEHPVKDPPIGLYIGGNDPYDFDKAENSTSLGSTFIYKRFQGFEDYYDIIVAEYTARPNTADDYYENVMKLLIYYNARLLYENEKKGLFTYFSNKHRDYLLADQPDIINDIIGKSTVNRKKGIHMTKEIIKFSEILIKDWLNQEYAPGHKNITRILSEPLLEELIRYNDKGNFDRVRALQCLMIYREQLYNTMVKYKEKEERKMQLFEKPLFSNEWFETSSENKQSIFNL